MRDYRDAKAMAQTLRGGLKAQSIDISHSNALELIARALGYKDWQVLAAKLEVDNRPRKPSDRSTMLCSFCGKTQHEVAKLVAGPNVLICDECVGLCNDIVLGQDPLTYVGDLDVLDDKSTGELIALKSKVTDSIPRLRQLRDLIDAIGRKAGPPPRPDESDRPDPQTAFILRKSPQERAAYAAAVEERLAGIQLVAKTADSLLAKRDASSGSA